MKREEKIIFKKRVLAANVFAVFCLFLLAIWTNYPIESDVLRVFGELLTIPSLLIVGICFFYGLYLLVTDRKDLKMSLLILICSLIGISIVLYMKVNFP